MQGADGGNVKQDQVDSHRVRMEEQFAEIHLIYFDIYNTMGYNYDDGVPSIASRSF